MQENVLEVKNLCKYYAGVKALTDVSIAFREGEVHALAGENGAGKSTLIKLITGAETATSGAISVFGKQYDKIDPVWAINNGISAMYQEFNLIPYLTIAENIYYGKEFTKGIFINRKVMNAETKKSLQDMEIDIDPRCRICDLGVAYQQIVEIVKAVSAKSKILIMDEPTAPLTNTETAVLMKLIKKLKEANVTIIYISHRIEEIFEICDRVTVMRDGRCITTKNTKDITKNELISYMVGRELGEDYPERKNEIGNTVLKIENMNNQKLKDICFNVKKGEIVGFGGLVGAGRTEVMQALFGADHIDNGKITLNDKQVKISNPSVALANGIGLIPEDRKNQGVHLGLSVRDNISFSSLKKISKGPFISKKKDYAISEKYCEKLRIKTPNINQLVKNLSGGNQQKVVLAKIMATQCDVLIFDEPTRGIDVGAKQEIYQLMRHIVDEGKCIVMVSSEMPELIGMSDRIYIMRMGKVVGELKREEFSQEKILEYASGLIGG